MMISVIIPAYRCYKTIIPVINSILSQDHQNFEIIIILDGKDNELRMILEAYPIKIIELEENMGPAFARNYGAKHAIGDILLFVDSDMVLLNGSFQVVIESFSNQSIQVIQGMYDKYPSNPSFITNLAAMKKWLDYQPEHLKEIHTIGSELFAIRKEIFSELNGFNVNYKKPTVEDYEFGYRIDQKYPIVFQKDLRGKHTFPNAKKMIQNYFTRSKEWAALFLQKKKKHFDVGATNSFALYSGIILWIEFCLILTFIIGSIIEIGFIRQILSYLIITIILLYLCLNLLNTKYWIGFTKEYSLIMAIISVHFIFILNLVSSLGGAIGILTNLLSISKRNEQHNG